FLNFRGEQLRDNFVSHLTYALTRDGINFFIDEKEQRGQDLENLFVRIEESSIALAIFSSRYPESKWCMDELVVMQKFAKQGNLRVIPIFYKVEPEDVRHPTLDSEFGKNFLSLAEASTQDQVKEWKEALKFICGKMGSSLREKSSESDFVNEIAKNVKELEESQLQTRKNQWRSWAVNSDASN
ncbi:hypothetical protein CARUB_v10018622mg, partial [Capsella rubella]